MKYFMSMSSGISGVPEFVSSALLDDLMGGNCDSNKKKVELNYDWITKYLDSEHLKWYHERCIMHQDHFDAAVQPKRRYSTIKLLCLLEIYPF